MSSYGKNMRYFGLGCNPKKAIIGGIISIVVLTIIFAVLCGIFGQEKYQTVTAATDESNAVYSQENGTTSLDLELKLTYSFARGGVLTDVVCDISFFDKAGNLLETRTVELEGDISEFNGATATVNLTFGEGGLDPINGNVKTVKSEVVSYTAINRAIYEDATGFKYFSGHWGILISILLFIACSFLSAFSLEWNWSFFFDLLFIIVGVFSGLFAVLDIMTAFGFILPG